jgi:hypothetical protein
MVKAKAVAGIILGLRFTHSFGFVHGHCIRNNILFDSDHCIHIVDFTPMILLVDDSGNEEGAQLEAFSGEGWTPEIDIEAFASILFELLFGRSSQGQLFIPSGIPNFISTITSQSFIRYLKHEIHSMIFLRL